MSRRAAKNGRNKAKNGPGRPENKGKLGKNKQSRIRGEGKGFELQAGERKTAGSSGTKCVGEVFSRRKREKRSRI
jgi:hypothetical protein